MKLKAKVLIPVVSAVAAVAIGIGVYFYLNANGETEDIGNGRIPYAQGTVIMDSDDVEETEDGYIALLYNYQARSDDGQNFSCLLANSPANGYDLYFDIYTDIALTDRVFLSGLLAPGTAFEQITLDRALPEGTNSLYVVFTQADDNEEGQQVLLNQTVVTVDFIVSE